MTYRKSRTKAKVKVKDLGPRSRQEVLKANTKDIPYKSYADKRQKRSDH